MQSSVKPSSDGQELPVLVVDLDGTLVRTDTMHESLLSLAASRPFELKNVIFGEGKGKAGFKSRLADQQTLDPSLLPYNEAVLDIVREAQANGQRTALVSASDSRQVEAIAKHLDLFDEAHGSSAELNLAADAKVDFLVDRFGQDGFSYMGDSSADLAVWAKAKGGHIVSPKRGVESKAREVNPELEVLSASNSNTSAWMRALRPHQWAKNALIFLPVLAAHSLSGLYMALIAFVAFSLTASAIYILNDLLDLPSDRSHPRKRKRPFAAGSISAMHGLMGSLLLLLTAFSIAALGVGAGFTGVLVIYLIVTSAYSLVLKRKPLVDVLTLAGLYTLRIYAGAVATAVVLSPWMLGFSIFFFLSLAAVKRQAELVDMKESGREDSGRGYDLDDLPIVTNLALSSGVAAILVLALYISSDDVQRLYEAPELLWFVCPLLLYWSIRMVFKAHKGGMTDDPIVFAASDRISLLIVALSGAIVVAAAF